MDFVHRNYRDFISKSQKALCPINANNCVGISLLLAHVLIENNGAWFKPFRRDAAVVFIAIVTVIGQLLLRSFLKIMIYFSDRENVSS